jgi:hypothetical protein
VRASIDKSIARVRAQHSTCQLNLATSGRSQCELSFTFGMSHDDRADARCGAPTHEHEPPPASRQLAHSAPSFGDDMIGEFLHVFTRSLQDRHLHAGFVVQVDVKRCLCEIMMIMEIACEALRQFALVMVVDVNKSGETLLSGATFKAGASDHRSYREWHVEIARNSKN